MRKLLILAMMFGLISCVTDYHGQQTKSNYPEIDLTFNAKIVDSYVTPKETTYGHSLTAATFFMITGINDQPLESTVEQLHKKYYGQGAGFLPQPIVRNLARDTRQVTLTAMTYIPAPIVSIFTKKYNFSGTVEFQPLPNTNYIVNGVANDENQQIWIEEYETRIKVTEIVDVRPDYR